MSASPDRALLAATLAFAAACADARRDPLSAVLITLDTTNAGALGCYGRRAGVTPYLDALAAEGLVYDGARSVAPLTLPSHASMMTGLYPPRHTLRDNGLHPLPSSAVTLAERARARGYETAAFVAAVVLAAPFGLDQGFDVYDEPGPDRASAGILERPAHEVTRAAVGWLERRDRSRPFFLWVHYYDPHAPYAAEPRFLRQVGSERGADDQRPRFPEYLAEVAQADAAIGRLLAALEEEGALEHTFIAVVADHGEALHRHDEPTHSLLVYDTTIRVPLMLRYPDGHRAGERSSEIVSVADVYPTLVEALGLGDPGPVDGQSLFRRSVPRGRGVYFESLAGYLSCGWSPLCGWADEGGTYLHSPEPELFAPGDERQERNRIAEEAAAAERYRERIARVAARPALAPDAPASLGDLPEKIRALGYVGGGDPSEPVPHPLETAGRPNPREHVAAWNACLEAAVLALELPQEGRVDEVVQRLEAQLEATPGNRIALEMLARVMAGREHHARVIELLEPAVDAGSERHAFMLLLGDALEHEGRDAEALAVYARARERWPAQEDFRKGLARVLARLERAGG